MQTFTAAEHSPDQATDKATKAARDWLVALNQQRAARGLVSCKWSWFTTTMTICPDREDVWFVFTITVTYV